MVLICRFNITKYLAIADAWRSYYALILRDAGAQISWDMISSCVSTLTQTLRHKIFLMLAMKEIKTEAETEAETDTNTEI